MEIFFEVIASFKKKSRCIFFKNNLTVRKNLTVNLFQKKNWRCGAVGFCDVGFMSSGT